MDLDIDQPRFYESVYPGGFVVGGKNSTDIIKRITSINGIPLSELQRRMRPHAAFTNRGTEPSICFSGFLGHKESLIDVMMEDNDYVLGKGLNHQQIASELAYFRDNFKPSMDWQVVERYGRSYWVRVIAYSGGASARGQESPFGDDTRTNVDVEIVNRTALQHAVPKLPSGDPNFLYMIGYDINPYKIKYSGLHPEMIHRYGFYEGKKTEYRLEPSRVINVLDYLIEQPSLSPNLTTSRQESGRSAQEILDEIFRRRGV